MRRARTASPHDRLHLNTLHPGVSSQVEPVLPTDVRSPQNLAPGRHSLRHLQYGARHRSMGLGARHAARAGEMPEPALPFVLAGGQSGGTVGCRVVRRRACDRRGRLVHRPPAEVTAEHFRCNINRPFVVTRYISKVPHHASCCGSNGDSPGGKPGRSSVGCGKVVVACPGIQVRPELLCAPRLRSRLRLDVLRIGDGDASQMGHGLRQHGRSGVDRGRVWGAACKFPTPNVPAYGHPNPRGPVNHGLPAVCGPHQPLFARPRVTGQPALAHRRDGLLAWEPLRIEHNVFRQSSGTPHLDLAER